MELERLRADEVVVLVLRGTSTCSCNFELTEDAAKEGGSARMVTCTEEALEATETADTC